MIESIDTSLIDWSRAQFALTAMYHWIFVPLTLGLAVVMAIMETLYYKTGNEFWKRTAKFWMKLFGINFAVGVATGLILEFEFGTNWSNYSWFVGDISVHLLQLKVFWLSLWRPRLLLSCSLDGTR